MIQEERPADSAFPGSFLFGVGTSDHQCEAYDALREDLRDVWDRELHHTPRGMATDFAVRYPEDIALARELGCKVFRISIAWSRVEPAPGVFDQGMFDHYRRVIRAILEAKMEPLVTLHHFTWPVHVEAAGGMIGDSFPALFARYADEVARQLGEDVRYWVTFNEPSQLIFGYIKPWWESDYPMAPGLPPGASLDEQARAIEKLMHNLFLAHSEARSVIKSANPDAMVGSNPLLLGLPLWLQKWIDSRARRVTTRGRLARHARRLSIRPVKELGKVDVVLATMTRTRGRERHALFSDHYYAASLTLMVKVKSGIEGIPDLAGKTIALIKGSTAETYSQHHLAHVASLRLKSYAECVQALQDEKADALLADDTIIHHLMAAHSGSFQIAAGNLTTELYAAAVTPGNQDLLDLVNSVIHGFAPSRQWSSRYPHFVPGLSAPDVESILASRRRTGSPDPSSAMRAGSFPRGTALRRIQRRGYLVAAVKEDVPGFGSRDSADGTLDGLEVELAHALAARLFGDPSRVRFRVASTEERLPLLRSAFHFLATIQKDVSILSAAFSSNWWNLGMAGLLPEHLCPKRSIGQLDFIGIDYYWGIGSLRLDRIRRLIESASGHFDQAPVWPEALYWHLRYNSSLLPGLPILIVENGSVPQADRLDRSAYIRQHIRQVMRALRDGIRVRGYVCWSITSNREWGLEFGKGNDFGLYHIDLDGDPGLKRQETSSAAEYRAIIGGMPPASSTHVHDRTQEKALQNAARDSHQSGERQN